MPKVRIWTDGSGTTKGPGGWAAVLRYVNSAGEETYREISGGLEETTNQRAEMTAVLEALMYLKVSCEVELTTDSQYVKKGMENYVPNWIRYGWTTQAGEPVKNRDLWESLHNEARKHRLTIRHVKGHSGDVDNERCDELAGAERKRMKVEVFKKAGAV
jgi:ribonuclease HI